jgi:hypothetical protein
MFVNKGVKTDTPPISVQPMGADNDFALSYRKTPYLIQAAQQGSVEIFQMLVDSGRPIFELGHICLSKKRKNSVVSNVIACAAYNGHAKLLKYLINKSTSSLIDQINLPCQESLDIRPLKTGPMVAEFEGYTPLMLAVVSEKASLEIVK